MIQIAICDDSNYDTALLKSILREVMEKYSIHFNIHEYKSAEKLMMAPLSFHLIFLDIIINGADGIEIGRQIYRRNKSIKIVFQTKSVQYCQEAINKSHAFAFLEKPLQLSAVEEQIREFLENNENTQDIKTEFRNVKCVSNGNDIIKPIINLTVNNILYFEYIKLHKEIKIVSDNGNYLYSGAMNSLEKRMTPFGFEICCRGILVNLKRIKRIKGYDIILDNDSTLPLSQRRSAGFKKKMNEYIYD